MLEAARQPEEPASRKIIELIAETLDEGILVISPDLRIEFANSAAERVFGRSKERIVGLRCDDSQLGVTTIEGQPLSSQKRPAIKAAQQRKAVYGAKLAVRLKNAESRRISVSAVPLLEKPKNVTSIVEIFEITPDREPDEARVLLRSIIEHSEDAIISKTLDGTITGWNKSAERMYGYTAREAVDRSILIITPPEKHAEIKELLAKIARGEHVEHLETERMRKDGSTVQISLSISPIKNSTGQIVGASTIARDITEKRRAEKELERQRDLNKSLINSSSVGISAIDLNYRFTLWGPGMELITGYTKEQVIGKKIFSVFPFLKDLGEDSFISKAFEGLETASIDRPFRIPKTKRKGFFEGRYSPLRNAEGHIIGALAVIRDMTERKNNEERLRESEALFRLVIDNARESIAAGTVDGKVLVYNRASQELTGYTIEELNEQGWYNLIFPDWKMRLKALNLMMQAARGKLKRADFPLVRKNGTTAWISWALTPLVIGGRNALLTVATDITERRRAKELGDALNSIYESISSTLDFDQILKRAITLAGRALEVESAGLLLYENDEFVVRYAYGVPWAVPGFAVSAEELPDVARAVETGQTIAVNDVLAQGRANVDLLKRLGALSSLIAPLIVKGRVIGVLGFNRHSQKAPFSATEIEFSNRLASALALALENAEIYATQRTIADTLQKSLLTLPQTVRGIRFGQLYRSATETTEVGGDFYDIFELGEGTIGLVIGDVVGKGLDAAALTSLIKNAIRAYAYEHEDPAVIVSRTNDFILEATAENRYATLIFGLLDTASGRLSYCNAGHPPALLVHGGSEVSKLWTGSPIIGAFPDVAFAKEETTITPGDTLVFYTDGVTEARRHSELFGESRIVDCVKRTKSVIRIPECVFEKVLQFSGNQLLDDIAILTVSLEKLGQ